MTGTALRFREVLQQRLDFAPLPFVRGQAKRAAKQQAGQFDTRSGRLGGGQAKFADGVVGLAQGGKCGGQAFAGRQPARIDRLSLAAFDKLTVGIAEPGITIGGQQMGLPDESGRRVFGDEQRLLKHFPGLGP